MSTTQESSSRNPLRLLMHVPVPWVFVAIYLAGVFLEYVWPAHAVIATLAGVGLIGSALFCIGAVLAGWGLLTFRRARTTTVPGQASTRLVTSGPYRLSRNPMYVGLILAYVGEAGIMRQVWPMLLLPSVVAYLNWVVIPVEEHKLTEVFGEAYKQYQGRVHRWL